MKPILLFDIDGTLLRIERNFMNSLITDILKNLSLDDSVLENTPFAGRTDQSIFRSLLGTQKNNEQLYQKIKESYVERMHEQLTAEHVTTFEHVTSCLNYFKGRNYDIGLLTGNFKEIAAHKLGLAGINNFFSFGAFGCDHTDRNMLGKAAQDSYREIHTSDTKPGDFLIIGDTPLDIRCAKHFGCRSVVVTTGHYSKEELGEHSPDMILENLEKPEEWVGEF